MACLVPREVQVGVLVAYVGKKFCEKGARFDLQRAVVVAGVTAEILCVVHVAVHHELHPMLRVEQQPHHRGGAGVRVEQLLHLLRRGEGQAGRADLRGEALCGEPRVAGACAPVSTTNRTLTTRHLR